VVSAIGAGDLSQVHIGIDQKAVEAEGREIGQNSRVIAIGHKADTDRRIGEQRLQKTLVEWEKALAVPVGMEHHAVLHGDVIVDKDEGRMLCRPQGQVAPGDLGKPI